MDATRRQPFKPDQVLSHGHHPQCKDADLVGLPVSRRLSLASTRRVGPSGGRRSGRRRRAQARTGAGGWAWCSWLAVAPGGEAGTSCPRRAAITVRAAIAEIRIVIVASSVMA
jgi:hypothetical protein